MHDVIISYVIKRHVTIRYVTRSFLSIQACFLERYITLHLFPASLPSYFFPFPL